MPAIKIKRSIGNQLDKLLQDVLDTESNKWSYFFEPHRIKLVFVKLIRQIKSHNFFVVDYSIDKFLNFLKAYVKTKFTIQELKAIDKDILDNLSEILHIFKNRIMQQSVFNETQIITATNYLSFFKLFLEWNTRSLLENNQITLCADDLKHVAIKVIENNNGSIHDFVRTYISTLKLSFDAMVFLRDYQKANQGVVSIAKSLFLQKDIDININLAVTEFFALLAYESKLVGDYKKKLFLSDVQPWQENITLAATDLQQFFFEHLDRRDDISKAALKFYFFKYFLEEANLLSPLIARYTNYLSYYSDKNFNPLPYIHKCPTLGENKFSIQHAGLEKNKLEIVCQAQACTDRNHAEWLIRTGNNQNLRVSHYIYHIFNNESSYATDIYRYVNFEPMSTGFFIGKQRNATHAIGNAYVQYRPDPTSWWVVSAHEYAHQLNFRAFGYIPRSFDEGLSYRLILDVCFDAGFQFWLGVNRNNYTSLDLLSSQEFIGYNPSSLFMSYFVDTNPHGFAQLLVSYQKRDPSIPMQITQLIQQDDEYLPWLDAYQKACSNPTFRAVGSGDNYCPDLLQKKLTTKKNTENFSTGKTSMPLISKNTNPPFIYSTPSMPRNPESTLGFLAKKPSADEMGRELIFSISNKNLDEFQQLLRKGANPNYRENGKTILHFLYFYTNCDTQYLESLLIHGAKITTNNEGRLPYEMAEQGCNATQLEAIKFIFDKFTPAKLEETGLTPYQQKNLKLTINVPIFALVSGVIAGGWEEVAQRNREQYPYLPNIIFYGLKPASIAIGTATMNALLVGPAESIGLEDAWLSFAYYLGANYLGLMLAQLEEKVTKKIQSKFLNILMPILVYTFFLNPSLIITLLSEGFGTESLQAVMMPLLSMLSSGILFKAGDYATQKVIKKFFPTRVVPVNNNQNYFLGNSFVAMPREISTDQKTLEEIQLKLTKFIINLKRDINNQVYKLNFDEDIESATANITKLSEGISKDEQVINRQEYGEVFKAFENVLVEIQQKLNKLLKNPKIQLLWKDVTEILTCLRGIRPSPPIKVNPRPDLLANQTTIDVSEEEQSNTPLMSTFNNGIGTQYLDNNGTCHYQVPSRLKRITSLFQTKTDLPQPPTDVELQEMMRDQSYGRDLSMTA